MGFKPLARMLERITIAKEESESSLFLVLLYTGEMVTKFVVSELVAAIQDDRDRQRYRQLHRLIRADGLGEWVAVMDEVLIGPATQRLIAASSEERGELTSRCGAGTWQHESVLLLQKAIKAFDSTTEDIPTKIEGRRWFSLFVKLRNLTRGHGAHYSGKHSLACNDLEKSLQLIMESYTAFRRPWVFLHRSLSGKYRVTKITDDSSPFDPLRSTPGANYPDGVYVHLDRHARVELVHSDVDVTDFYLPNGGFKGKKYELLSYITGSVIEGDATPYMAPATELAASETQGIGLLDIQGKCFGNLPPPPNGYISRHGLESELEEKLLDDRHPVLTLVGRGGIGKTSLALSVLHKITETGRFGAILWFSSRDIDLLPEGPKLVRPHVLDENDIAAEFVRLMNPSEASVRNFNRVRYLAQGLTKSPIDSPMLYVFDNFETVSNPIELYTWLV
jgi:hypothetical protein